MHCFAVAAIEGLLIKLVIIWAVFAVARVLLGLVPSAGEFAWLISAAVQIIKIILVAIIVIAIIIVAFELLVCAL